MRYRKTMSVRAPLGEKPIMLALHLEAYNKADSEDRCQPLHACLSLWGRQGGTRTALPAFGSAVDCGAEAAHVALQHPPPSSGREATFLPCTSHLHIQIILMQAARPRSLVKREKKGPQGKRRQALHGATPLPRQVSNYWSQRERNRLVVGFQDGWKLALKSPHVVTFPCT